MKKKKSITVMFCYIFLDFLSENVDHIFKRVNPGETVRPNWAS